MDGVTIILVIFNIIALLGVSIFVFMNSTSIVDIEDKMALKEAENKISNNNELTLKTDIKELKTEMDAMETNMETVKTRIGANSLSSNTSLTNDLGSLQTDFATLTGTIEGSVEAAATSASAAAESATDAAASAASAQQSAQQSSS